MMIKIFNIIYFSGVIAGLLFPLADSFMNKIPWYKNSIADRSSSRDVEYTKLPIIYKIVAAFIPIFNLAWIFVLLLMLLNLIKDGFWELKKWIVRRMAKSVRRNFVIKVKVVKRLFPAFLQYFYSCVDYEIAKRDGQAEIVKRLLKLMDNIKVNEAVTKIKTEITFESEQNK
jgi:hypothetical protein